MISVFFLEMSSFPSDGVSKFVYFCLCLRDNFVYFFSKRMVCDLVIFAVLLLPLGVKLLHHLFSSCLVTFYRLSTFLIKRLTLCLLIPLQYHHCLGEGSRERRLRAHHQAVPQCARVHRQRQLRHLQCLREDLGRRPPEPDREAKRRRSPGGAARLREPTGHRAEGTALWWSAWDSPR